MRRVLSVLAAIVVMAFVGFFAFVNCANAPAKKRIDAANRAAAEQVVSALQAHREGAGTYPATLAELVPARIPAVPPCATVSGTPREFGYERGADGKSFVLRYPEAPFGALPSDGEYVWDSARRDWSLEVH